MRKITDCEVCGSLNLVDALNLGLHPMCDDIVTVGDNRVCKEYPIEILFCNTCKTAHQKFQIPKEELFPSSYHYRSRFTADVLSGMAALVESCKLHFGDLAKKKVLDIGCNDGSLLGFFRDQGCKTIGIDPTNAADDAIENGHEVYKSYVSADICQDIVDKHGAPDLITFTNVFAHIEDLNGLLECLKILIGRNTSLIIENHYLGSVFARNQFDTFYHEHPRTYSLTSFINIAHSLGMSVVGAEFPSRYGGNIRVFIGPINQESNNISDELKKIIEVESNFIKLFSDLAQNIEIWKRKKGDNLKSLVSQYGPLKAKAFPGRAAILIKLLNLDEQLISAVYEKPGSLKIGHYVPGTRIPIKSDFEFQFDNPQEPLLNLAWHISDEIRRYMASKNFKGEIIDILAEDDFL